MTAPTRNSTTVFDAQVAAGTTTAATALAATTPQAGNGGWIDVRGFNGGYLAVSVTNGASAPGAPLKYIIQCTDVSGSTFFADRWAGAGDVVAAGYPKSALIQIPSEISFIRVLAFGNTTNNVGLKAVFFSKA